MEKRVSVGIKQQTAKRGVLSADRWMHRPLALFFPAIAFLFLVACTQQLPAATAQPPITARIQVDGETREVTATDATTIRELLAEANVTLNDADEVAPPLFTPLETAVADGEPLTIEIVRVTESIEVIPRRIPFQRKLVRNEAMDANEPPRIIQPGQDGLQEETVRIVYRDGLEAERWITQVTVIEPAQDEIVMVGIGAARGNVSFTGTLAYISGGNAVVLRGLTAFPEPLDTGGRLDGRVFALSPTGDYLLYTRVTTDTTSFNNRLYLMATEADAEPRALGVENVLWAGWDPAQIDTLRIAYTTANPTNLPPGWEANNDLWLGEIPATPDTEFEPEQLIEAYPATYGWWGGNYAWSPQGRLIGYSYANEVGVIDIEAETDANRRRQLQTFTEYNTRSDWVWVPTLTWSPDGRFLAFTNHGSDDPERLQFDSWVVDVNSGIDGRFVEQSGMWAHMHWTSVALDDDGQIAYLQATDPVNSQRSNYALWLMDQDGSNGRRLYPPPGEISSFPREQHFMAWGPSGRDIAFIFDDALFLFNLDSGEAHPVTQDDASASHPTWAPYGVALAGGLPSAQPDDSPTTLRNQTNPVLPEN